MFETYDFDIGQRDDVIALSVDLKETEKKSFRIDFLKFKEGMARSAAVGKVFAMEIARVDARNNVIDSMMIIPTAVFDDLVSLAHEKKIQRDSKR